MRIGSLVVWKFHLAMGIQTEIGLILELIPHELRMGDQFPHWRVLFPTHPKLLHCRESDLQEIQ